MKDWTEAPVDGSKALVDGFGGEELFIKKTIENCIFFDPLLVAERFNEVIEKLYFVDNSSKEKVDEFLNSCRDINFLPVRKSGTKSFFYKIKTTCVNIDHKTNKVIKLENVSTRRKQDCLICIDKDGNYAVKDIIKSKTCCVVAKGDKQSLKNYIISHIWGQARDPRYFSNLWNIVLVPSYANPLLDKNYEKDSTHPGAKLLNTLKAVMTSFYCFDDLEWDKLKINQPSYEKNQMICIKEKLKIHYLKRKPYDSSNGSVEQEIKEADFDIVDTEYCNKETRVYAVKDDKNTSTNAYEVIYNEIYITKTNQRNLLGCLIKDYMERFKASREDVENLFSNKIGPIFVDVNHSGYVNVKVGGTKYKISDQRARNPEYFMYIQRVFSEKGYRIIAL